ncbi:MAG: PEP-CTERM sorting domain-containing protein [Myxococcota bacterium]
MKRTGWSLLGVVVALLFFALEAGAQGLVVNVDIGPNGDAPYVGQGALSDSGIFWNATGGSGTEVLRDSLDTVDTPIRVAVSGGFNFRDDTGVPNALLQDYSVVSVFNNTVYEGNFTISGLQPDTSYLLYVYSAGNGDGQAGVIEIETNGALGATSGRRPASFAGDQSDFVEGRNYVVVEVRTDSSPAPTIVGNFRPFANDAGINGFQIQELAGPLAARVQGIEGSESPTVHSAGDVVRVEADFSKVVTLDQVGGSKVQIDFDGTLVDAVHVGPTTGTALGFEATAPAGVTTLEARVLTDSLELLGGASLTSDGLPVELDHAEFALTNDQVSSQGLAVYSNQIPDPESGPGATLDPSPYYSIRVRETASSTWQSPFAWVSQSRDDDDVAVAAVDGSYKDLIGGWSHTYANFEMANNVEIEVEITRLNPTGPNAGTQLDIERAVAHPRRKVKSWRVENGRAYVVIDKPVLLSVDIDGEFDDNGATLGDVNENASHAVSVFANPFILDKPDPADPNVRIVQPGERPPYDGTWTTLSFLPGVHQLFDAPWADGDAFDLESGKSYYIPGDAIVHGNMTNEQNDPEGGRNIRIYGHGTLSGEKVLHHDELGIINPFNTYHANKPIYVTGDARGSRIEGVTITDSANHSIALIGKWNVDVADHNFVRWTKVFTWRANGDGISPNGSGYLEDSFLRTQDDGTYVGALGIRRNVYWSDVNGMALRCSNMLNDNPAPYMIFGDLLVEDIDVLYAREFFSQFQTPEQQRGASVIGLWEPAVASPFNDGSHIVFRDIHVHDLFPTRMLFGWDMGSGTTELVDRVPVSDVRIENVRAAARNLRGDLDPFVGIAEATISDLILDDVIVGGKHYEDELTDLETNAFATGFDFQGTVAETMTFQNSSGLGKWYIKDDWDSGVEPANNDLVNHTAFAGELIVDAPVYAGTLNVSHPATAVVSIENGGQLEVSDQITVGAGTGEIQLLDGGLTLLNDQASGLSVGAGGIHFEKGTLEWAGDHVADLQSLVLSGGVTFSNGLSESPFGTGVLIGQVGGTELFASFDSPTPGATTAWAVPEPSAMLGLASGVLALLGAARRRRGLAPN